MAECRAFRRVNETTLTNKSVLLLFILFGKFTHIINLEFHIMQFVNNYTVLMNFLW